jgi:serine/threonine-protein kinase
MIGQTISHYKILDKLGEGGMGVVYKAHDTKLDRDVALKFLPSHISTDDEVKQRFIHEAQAASALNHTNICSIHAIEEFEKQQFIDMEFVEGKTLGVLLKEKELSLKEVLDIALQIAEGLNAAHKRGIVHRDIKPDNIMVTDEGLVKIMDFGLAKLKGSSKLTKTHSTLGTLSYMSPEQARGEEVDQRSDIFSLGAVLYEMITGRRPFKGEHEAAIMYSLLNEMPEPLARYKADISDEMQRVIDKALAKEKGKRYQHVDEMLADLRRVQQETPPPAKAKRKITKFPLLIGVGIAAVAFVVLAYFFLLPKSVPPGEKSIAVLPFVDMSPQKDQEYFCDGMTEALINRLSNVQELRVPARTSAFFFKGKKGDVREVGNKLNVQTVLEGSVQKSGNRLRITVQLINVSDGYHLWSEKYDRELKDIFAIQDEITLAIMQKLKMHLLSEERAVLMTRYTDNIEAYNLYSKGRYFWNKRTVDAMESSIKYFRQAAKEDPKYALAYVGIADAYIMLAYTGLGAMNPQQAYPQARQAILKALEIDKTLAEAHASLAMIHCSFDWDWANAEKEFKLAITLNPNYAYTHHWYAIYLTQMGRLAEADIEIKKARELEPFSLIINVVGGLLLFMKGDYDSAIVDLQETLKLEPNFWLNHLYLGYSYYAKGLSDKAFESLERAVVLSEHAVYPTSMLGYFRGLSGDTAKAKEILNELEERAKQSYVLPSCFYHVYFGVGNLDSGFVWVDRAFQIHDPSLLWLNIFPLKNERVYSDSRFVEVLKKMGLKK